VEAVSRIWWSWKLLPDARILKLQRDAFYRKVPQPGYKAAAVQSRIKALAKVERVVIPRNTKKIHFSFPEPPRSGEE